MSSVLVDESFLDIHNQECGFGHVVLLSLTVYYWPHPLSGTHAGASCVKIAFLPQTQASDREIRRPSTVNNVA